MDILGEPWMFSFFGGGGEGVQPRAGDTNPVSDQTKPFFVPNFRNKSLNFVVNLGQIWQKCINLIRFTVRNGKQPVDRLTL